ncbi:MAG: glycoside hydrolase family 44 protein, partial [Polyangiaceae bacterium]
FAGMQAFLNYDGSGAHFGDTSVKATSSDASAASIYASTDSKDPSHLVVVVINKQTNGRMADITVSGSTKYSSCAVYMLTSSGAKLTSAPALSPKNGNELDYQMPALSVSVLVPKS